MQDKKMDVLGDSVGMMCASAGALTAIAGAAAVYYMSKMPDPTCIPPIDLNDQSYVLEDGSRCSKLMPKGELLDYKPHKDVCTLLDVFKQGVKTAADSPFLGTRSGPNREYEWITYQESYDQARWFGSWLLDQGLESGKDNNIIGVFAQNRQEWIISDLGCRCYNLLVVALYETLGHDAIIFVINQTQMPLLVCDSAEKVNKILSLVEEAGIKHVKTLVVMDNNADVNSALATKLGINIVTFQDALEKGKANLKPEAPPSPDDVAIICYTSGTTGNPKGVMTTHRQFLSMVTGVQMIMSSYRVLNKDDVHLSYLPLAHNFERASQQLLYLYGARIGFFSGDIKLLLDDLQTLRPTFFISVPRLLNKIYDKVMSGVSQSKIKSTLLQCGLDAKMRDLRRYVIRKDSIWDKLLFKKVQALFGGRVDILILGSAPMSGKVLDFFRASLGCVMYEAFGQTEAVAAVTMTIPCETLSGMVGPPMPQNFVKLVDSQEQGYFAANNQGEVLVKGGNVASGYYKEPEKTAETFDKDGWLHTGDIGEWLPNGTLKIIDRKKNIFKLAQGEYIAPEKIETVYCRSKFVAQVFVEGNSLQPFAVAIVVPDEEVLLQWACNNGVTGKFQDLCESQSIKQMVLTDIVSVGKAAKLNSLELVKDVFLCPEPFTVENNLLTPTFKNKRPELRKFFKGIVEEMYKYNEQ
ncbi:long-chain-fatty-acid--CoA ligase 5-like isoform X2 [Mya arenaria]|uniref:long-chain-fatty-acid--CoA ligase 5-like isoform X2 n=2 Tax=Mya arenaria TaxID=6604 RepID=UPI0022E71722|nr:long-chain-fatty-acid--CoA ligase 5-like isoform X2 [Mya arenaria]